MMGTRKELPMTTGTTQHVLDFIRKFQAEHPHQTPTYREIMEAVGVKSTGAVSFHVNKLVSAGQLAPVNHKARALIILEQKE
jgi:SOS-response transcriptional repressor LexA